MSAINGTNIYRKNGISYRTVFTTEFLKPLKILLNISHAIMNEVIDPTKKNIDFRNKTQQMFQVARFSLIPN